MVANSVRNNAGETVNDILWNYHRRRSVEAVLGLDRHAALAKFNEKLEALEKTSTVSEYGASYSSAREIFMAHSADETTMSNVQFMVLLARMGLKVGVWVGA